MLIALFAACSPATDTTDCGLDAAVIPDFALEDMNPTSPTYGEIVSRDDHIGDVWFMYWAHAT